ncbi:uncharacterized protein DUF1801 [Shimia isoporae]|uniref:Uncharacterized protein DUF1801 n=1 Tax=Shimia isoporae TaxID=647720 RepID=A0A4R1NY01_9RHOB|nr:DUF1801 domain-containing protein [Shimia isoporae]TCL10148.1 uncharacterized protein DUF1801 [Shimia isoporae]
MTESTDVSDLITALPEQPRSAMLNLRALIHATATETGVAVEEALKWGQPSFAPPKRIGTPIRLNWSQKTPDRIDLLVHCQTTLVSDWRALFPEFSYDGSRALHIPLDREISKDALSVLIASALTYRKKAKAGET